jgi:hypothetical protein
VSVGTNGISVLEHRDAYLPTPLVWNGKLNGWTHIAVVYDHYVPKLFVNGVLVRIGLDTNLRSAVVPGDIFPSKSFGDPVGYGAYDGLLDDVAIFDRALSVAEIHGLALPELLNINFGTDINPTRTGPAATGLGPADVWNLYSRDLPGGGFRNDGTLALLKWSDGIASPAGLTVSNAAGAKANGSSDSMFGVCLYPLTANPTVTLLVTNLTEGLYDFYAYGHGGPSNQENSLFGLVSGGDDYGDRATASNGDWTLPNWVEGAQFVLYTNVVVRSDQPLVLRARPGASPLAYINGLQIARRSSETLALSPAGGLFTNHQAVVILGAIGRDVRYTTDGSIPAATSSKYSGPIDIKVATVIQARVFTDGIPASVVYRAEYLRVYALNDGISPEWRLKFFGPGYLTNPQVAADADPDNDGATNLQEFGNGTNPQDPLDGFEVGVRRIPSITWRSVPNAVYRILEKDHLSDAVWVEIRQIRATGDRTTFSDESVTDSPRFYLIQAIP